MDEPADPVVAPPESQPATDPLRPYRAWATALFTLIAVLGLIAVTFALTALSAADVPVLILAFGAAFVGIAVYGATALGLNRLAAWAIHAIRPLCLVLIVSGVIRVLVGFAGGRIEIPIDAIGALLVLSRDHRSDFLPPLDGDGSRRRALVVIAAVAIQLLPLAGTAIRV